MLTTLGESTKRLVYHLQHFLGPTKGNYKSHSFDLTSQKKILWALYNKNKHTKRYKDIVP